MAVACVVNSGAATVAHAYQPLVQLPEDRVDLTASIIRVDASAGEMLLRLVVVPRGDLTTEGGLSPREDLEILSSAAITSDPYYPALERITPVDVSVALEGTDVTAYPLDRPSTTLEFSARMGGELVPVDLTLVNRDSLFAASANSIEDPDAAIVDVDLTRTPTIVTFAIFMMVAMWGLALAVVTACRHIIVRRRGLVWPALGWMAATMFAIVGFRNAAPGSPPIGSFIDYVAFFWAEAIIAVCVVATALEGARAERAAERIAAEP
jgi:hypothetical protein